jgi:hypothetical protein
MVVKSIRFCAVTVFLLLISAGFALAKDIVVVNGTSFSLHGMALSPSESNNWGKDFLEHDVLKPGEALTISINGDPTGWDLAVVDDDNNQLEFKNLNFRTMHKVTLLSDGTANLE